MINGIISKLALKFEDKKNMRSKILLGIPICMANHPSQIRIPIKPKIKIPNKFNALAAPLLNVSMDPTLIMQKGIKKGIRIIWFCLSVYEATTK